MKINEVDPRNYDSDIDYYDAVNRAGRKAYRDPDSYEKPEPYDAEDDIAQQRQAAAAKFRQKRETQWETKQEGTAPNGQKYNSRYIINAADKSTADMEEHSFTDYHWGAKKLVDKEYGKDGDRVVLTLYMVDNHKYGLWRPWKDSPVYKEGVAEGYMYGDEEVSWEKGGRRAPTGAFRNPTAKKSQPYNDTTWAKNLSKEKLDALAGPRYKKDKEQDVSEGGFKNKTAVFSGYSNYMNSRAPNVFKHYGIKVLNKEYFEDEDIVEFTVISDGDSLDKARAHLERSDQFGGMIRKQGVAEGQETVVSVVVGKLYDVIDHAEDIIKNADYDRQVQYATVLRDRATKALNMIKQGGNTPEAALDAFAYMQSGEQGVAEGFKNTYKVGDRVDSPLGTGVIVAVSPHISTDGRVKVKLDDPSRAGEDGKHKDTFVLDTTQLKHIADEKANPYAIGMSQAMKSTGDKPPLKKSTINKAHEIARAIKKGE